MSAIVCVSQGVCVIECVCQGMCVIVCVRSGVTKKKEKKSGDAGYRSPCPSHAKRMLYHLSYIPSAQA